MSPKKPKAQVKDDWLKIRATPDQLERWRRAGQLAHEEDEEIDFSGWVRTTLNQAAKALEERREQKRGKAGGR